MKKFLLVAPLLLSGCGNSWLSSSSREETPSALYAKGQWEYDKANFSKSVGYFEKVLALDSTNDRARIHLAYALNGAANLSPFALVNNLSKVTTTSGASGSSGSTTSLKSITDVAGLSAAEKQELIGKIPEKIADLRKISPKLATLHQGWIEVCRLLPGASLNKIVGTNTRLGNILEVSKCQGGVATGSAVKSSAVFAAVMSSLGIASALYQVFLDADADGNIDIVKSAESIAANIQAYKSQADAASNLAELSTKMANLNSAMADLGTLGQKFQGELFEYTLAEFEFVGDLIATGLLSLPTKTTDAITKGILKLNEAKEKAKSFSSSGTGNAGASKDKITAGAQNASQTLDTLVQKQETAIAGLSGSEKEAKEQQLARDKAIACTNYASLQTVYGLPGAKPASCNGVSLLPNNDEILRSRELSFQLNAEPSFDLSATEGTNVSQGVIDLSIEANRALFSL